jgi:imidazole glycerol-phosphate synthase subunit HisH
MKSLVSIIDYGMGNLYSIKCALDEVGINSIITRDSTIIKNSKAIIIPGVGSFSNAMKKIKFLKIDNIIMQHHFEKKIIFGICLGMQLLFDKSYEGKVTNGLGIIKGNVLKFKTNKVYKKSFNVGWKKIEIENKNKNKNNLLSKKDNYMYFIHSFYVKPSDNKIITSKSIFNGQKFVSSIKNGHVYGFQFHPEKSSKIGLDIYKCLKKILNK